MNLYIILIHHYLPTSSPNVDLEHRSLSTSVHDVPLRRSYFVRISGRLKHAQLTSHRPEFLSITELSDNPELQMYTSAVLYVLSAVNPPREYIGFVLNTFITAIKSSSVGTTYLF